MKNVILVICILILVGCMVGVWIVIMNDPCCDRTVCFCVCILCFSLVALEWMRLFSEIQIKQIELGIKKQEADKDAELKKKEIAHSENELAKRREHEVMLALLKSKCKCLMSVVEE